MSTESQADIVWQYAMDGDPIDGNTTDASLNVADGRSGGDVTTDLSDQLGSIPSKLSFHGLAQTQSQSQGAWLSQEASLDGLESQKENRHLPVPSGSSPPLILSTALAAVSPSGNVSKITGAGNCKAATLSHVTIHVTGASPAASFADPVDAFATASSKSVSLMEKHVPGIHASLIRPKAVSFLSPTSAPLPPTLFRSNTMPPRLGRYAPRNVKVSSQDSFAGPIPPQDLNAYVRNSRVFNNTYIRRSRDGRPGEVFEHPTHVSATTSSLSDPPPVDEIMSSSQSPQADDGPSVSQIVRAAFYPRLSPSPIPVPDPVILVRDSQSQHSRESKQEGHHNGDERDRSNKASGGNASSSISHSFHSHPRTPSPSVSYELRQEVIEDVTRSNTQSTQPNIQATQTDPPIQPSMTQPLSLGTNPDGHSPLPVPLYRQKQVAALQAARLRAVEVIPETPASTAGLSGLALTSVGISEAVDAPAIPLPQSVDVYRAQMGKEGVSEHRDSHIKPLSSAKGKPTEKDLPAHTTSRGTRSAKGISVHRPVADVSREGKELERSPVSNVKPARRHQPLQSEIVPDSEEEEEEEAVVHDRTSSSPVPLIQVLSRGKATVLRPPTPTPAAVKSPLRKGKLPEGVTHTRGRGHLSSVKGSHRIPQVVQKQLHGVVEDVALAQDEESMDLDEVNDQPEVQQLCRQIKKHNSGRIRSSKVKKERQTKKQNKALKRAPLPAGPSTRSRKRKSDTPAESSRDSEVPWTTSAPPKKRHRSIVTTTPAPTATVQLNIRVLARRADKQNFFLPGTVSVDTTPSDPVPASTVFTVQFDDGHEEDIDVEHMRQFELEPDDVVRVMQRRKGKVRVCSAQVLDVERWDSAEVAEVHELGQGPDADDYDIDGRFLSVSEDHIYDQWSERRVSTRTLLRDKDFAQPARNDSLAGMGFVITLPDIPKSKRSLIKLIEISGGLVYDDWSAIVSLTGSVEVAGKRIVGRTPDLRLGKESRKSSPSSLFCLTNEPRTTPKYLIALALGVPCLSLDWVLDRVAQDTDHYVHWPAYILPAGYSPVTRMPASQGFDRAWWLKGNNLPNLLSQPPILKPFAGKAFLCVGAPEFLFTKKELGTFPKVLLAMGASYVQAVTEVARINVKAPYNFDYTVVDDDEALVEYKDAIPVNVSWLKKCLVTGIEGPVPWPDREVS